MGGEGRGSGRVLSLDKQAKGGLGGSCSVITV